MPGIPGGCDGGTRPRCTAVNRERHNNLLIIVSFRGIKGEKVHVIDFTNFHCNHLFASSIIYLEQKSLSIAF